MAEQFIPLPELLSRGSAEGLSQRQLNLRKLHFKAQELHSQFRAIGKHTWNLQDPNHERGFEAVKKEAENAAFSIFKQAFDYYNAHGKLERGFGEIKTVARTHWHPTLHKKWTGVFYDLLSRYAQRGHADTRNFSPTFMRSLEMKIGANARKMTRATLDQRPRVADWASQLEGTKRKGPGDTVISPSYFSTKAESQRIFEEMEKPAKRRAKHFGAN